MIGEYKNKQRGSSRFLNCQASGEVLSYGLPGAFSGNQYKAMDIITMRKKHSPHLVRFIIDKDPHFARVELVRLSTGEVKARHLIIASDLQQWKRMYSDDGFIPVVEEVQVAPQKTELNRSKSDKVTENCTTVAQ